MSAPPGKRSHEESGNAGGSHSHMSSISKYPLDDLGTYSSGSSKLTPSVLNEYRAPCDVGQDTRMPKIARTESRDPDRRSPLAPIFRLSSSSHDLHSDHLGGGSESRLDFRDSGESNRDLKVEARDAKPEFRDSYKGSKVDKGVKFENRIDGSKETKHEKDTYPESRNDAKPDKDAYCGGSSQLNCKDSKELHRGKRYPDTPGRNLDPWHSSRTIVHGPAEVGKEGSNAEDKDYLEAREAGWENKNDLKGEDKFKDKDRERKDAKLREWGERDKERNDRLNDMQLCGSHGGNKDAMKEERDAERWDRERKDLSKDKERLKDREKDYMKREPWNGAEKEGLRNEKETVDVFRAVERENLVSEQKKQKHHESWKKFDKDVLDRKKGREGEVGGERPDKHTRYHDKEPDEGVDAEGGTEREREAFSFGVQQRKRMLRPRGSPHANRDPRFRSCSLDNEGFHGKPDVSTVIYRIGECMQELIKLWKEYESSQANGVSGSPQNGPTLEICIPSEHVSATNRQVRGGQLWGTDVYTNDSDLVAVLMHTGYCRPTASPPLSTIQELCATIRVLPPQDCYVSTLRNNVRSRAWGAAIGCSYRVERCCIVKRGGGTINLDPCLTQSSTLEPTLGPVAVERTMTTRAAASNELRQQRFVREFTIQFNLCHEPWLKYSISVIADKGLKKPLFTSSRLKKGEVLYLETHSRRYELCFEGEKIGKGSAASQEHETESDKFQNQHLHSRNEWSAADGENIAIDVFRWSRCKKPLPQKHMQSIGIPLPLEHVEVLEDNLEWDDIRWSQTGIVIAGKEYHLARVHFLSQN